MNWSEKQTEFWTKGFVIFDDFFPVELVEMWKRQTLHLAQNPNKEHSGVRKIHKEYKEADLETRDGAGVYDFISIDGTEALAYKSLPEWYRSLTKFLSLFTGLSIVTSLDCQSAITFMKYDAPGGQLVWHYDTNGYTFLLYLTDNWDGGTEMVPLTSRRPTNINNPDEIIGPSEIIFPKFNRVVFFDGRRVWHRSMTVNKDYKISSVWNYYQEGDNWRPPEVSKRLYS